MPAWLSRIRQALVRNRRPPEVYFSVECRCGERHQGIRGEQPQQLICPACENRVFIFPCSVYPPVKSRHGSGTAATPLKHTIEVESMDQSVCPPGAPLGVRMKLWFRRLGRRWLARLSSLFTPFRLIMLGMLLILGLTGWWMVYRAGQDNAERTWLAQVELARNAVADRNFAAAEEALTLAVAAADVLDEPAREEASIRQLRREVVAMNHLHPLTLWTMLQEGEELLRTQDVAAWQLHFERHFSSGWMVLQTELFAARAEEGQLLLQLDLPLSLAGDPLEIQGLPEELAGFLGDRDSRTALIALQWKSCRREGDRWILEPNLDTWFLWTGMDTFDALGVKLDGAERAGIQQLLQQQREFLDLE